MKKFLSLVLALVMTMSLVTISAGATFTDADKIDYKEAVDVMKAVKVIDGYADGSFNPNATLTRGAAAKIICNMLLGPTTAGLLTADTAPYKDVPANSTFAGYIAYCKSQGIINGYADGSFKPSANLNGYAFLKMLLGALGYDSKIEGYVGDNWTIAVAKQAKNNDLFKGNDNFVGSQAVTRQEACLYALNTLKAREVEYDDKGTTISINGVELVTGASKVDYKYADEDIKYYNTLFKGDLTTGNDTDDFGRSATVWTYKNNEVGKYGKSAKFVITEELSASKVATLLKGYRFAVDSSTYKINNDTKMTAANVASIPVKANNSDTTYTTVSGETLAKTIANLTANGKRIELYVGSDDASDTIVKAVEVNYSLGEVTKVSTNSKTGDVAYTISGLGTKYDYSEDSTRDDDITIVGGKVAKDDYVTYVTVSGMTYVYPTTVIEGKVTKANVSDYVVVDGTEYKQNASVVADSEAQKLWVDQYGIVVRGEKVDSTVDVVYVAAKYSEMVKGNTTNYVQIVDAEGVVSELKVKDGVTITANTTGKYTTDDGKVDSFTPITGMDKVVPLVATATNSNSTIKENAAKLTTFNTGAANTYFFADDVTFVYINKSGDDLKVTTSNTVDKVSTIPANSYAVLKDGEVVTVFIRAKAAASVKADELLFIADTAVKGTILDDEGKKTNAYEIYTDGVKDTHGVKSGLSGVGYYTYSVDSASGKYELSNKTEDVFKVVVDLNGSGKVYAINKDTYVSLGSTDLYGNSLAADKQDAVLSSDAVIYDTTDNGIVSLADIVATVEDDANVSSLTLYAVYDSKAEAITTIYVVK